MVLHRLHLAGRYPAISTNPPATIKAERSAVAAMRPSLDTETAKEVIVRAPTMS